MIKTIEIGGKAVKFSNNAAFFNIYKNQFGSDILTVIMPLITELIQNSDDLFKSFMDDESDDPLGGFKPSDIATLLEGVYSLEIIDLYRMAWSMAKCADKDISPFDDWLLSFDEMPIYDVFEELMPVLISSLISKKKLKILKAKWDAMKPKKKKAPSTSKSSCQEQSKED